MKYHVRFNSFNGLLDGLVMQHFVDPEALTEDDVVASIEMLALGLFEPSPPPSLPLEGHWR